MLIPIVSRIKDLTAHNHGYDHLRKPICLGAQARERSHSLTATSPFVNIVSSCQVPVVLHGAPSLTIKDGNMASSQDALSVPVDENSIPIVTFGRIPSYAQEVRKCLAPKYDGGCDPFPPAPLSHLMLFPLLLVCH